MLRPGSAPWASGAEKPRREARRIVDALADFVRPHRADLAGHLELHVIALGSGDANARPALGDADDFVMTIFT